MGHILVVDDNPGVREVVRHALMQAGHAVRTAADGPSGLSAALEETPELVILDVKMPGMDGPEVLRELKRLRADLPIFFFTVLGDFSDKTDLAEADGCFVKSSDLAPIVDAVSRVLASLDRSGRAEPYPRGASPEL